MRRIVKKATVLVSLVGFGALLASCGTTSTADTPGSQHVQAPSSWTQAELDNVLDLSELGKVTLTDDGAIKVGGKLLPSQLKNSRNLGYGRTLNYLKLNDETLNALPASARDFFLEASPEELQSALAETGVSIKGIKQLWDSKPSGNITWQAFRDNVYKVAEKAGKAHLFDVSRLNSADSFNLQPQAYSITGRTTGDAFVLDCDRGNGSYRIRSVSSTTSTPASYYIAAKTTLVLGGVTRGSSPVNAKSPGPISSVSASFNYDAVCQKIFQKASASGWHKGKQTSSSTGIIKTSSW